jgi:hypothetical protein
MDGIYPTVIVSSGPPQTPYLQVFDYDVNGNLIYSGWAAAGTALSAAGWAIQQNIFNGANQLTQSAWAGGNTDEVNIWNNRTALIYS